MMPDSHHEGAGRGAPTVGAATGRHTIDLTNAWEPPPAAPRSATPAAAAARGPAAAWARSFGLPTGLSSGDRVWLVLDGGRGCHLILNDSPLPVVGDSCAYAVDVTALLLPRNRLRLWPPTGVPLAPAEPTTGLPPHGRCRLPAAYGCVRLEIQTVVADGSPQETPAGA